MREAMHLIRAKIYAALNGNITLNGATVPVFNRVPTNQNAPYIWVYSLSTNEIDQNQTNFCLEVITRIECVTRFKGDVGGDLDSNLLISDCLNLLRTRASGYFDLSANNFSVYTSVNEGVTYERIEKDDHTYFVGILELSNRVEQTS